MRWRLFLGVLGAMAVAIVVDGGKLEDSVVGDYPDYSVDDFNVEIVGFGENCNGQTSKCENRSLLVCSPLGQCECPVDMTYSDETSKCQITNSPEMDSWPEEDVETWELSDENAGPAPSEDKVEEKVPEVTNPEVPEPNKTNDIPKVQISPRGQETEELNSSEEAQILSSEETIDSEEPPSSWEDSDEDDFWKRSEEEDDKDNSTSEGKLDQEQAPKNPIVPQHRQPKLSLPASQGCFTDANCREDETQNLRCNLLSGQCECFGPDVMEINGTCYLLRTIDDACDTEVECDAVIEGPAWCHTDLETSKTTCQCQVFSYWEAELQECLPYGTDLQSECRRDRQCSADEALGPHARCSEVTGQCECSNSLATEDRNIVFFVDRCIVERDLNGICRTDQDCEASLGPNALCDDEGRCGCKEGHECQKLILVRMREILDVQGSQLSTFAFVILGLVGAVLLVGGLLFLVIRRRDNYTFVGNDTA